MSVFRTSLVVRRVVSVTLVVIVSVTLYSTPKPSPLGLGPRRLGRGSRPVAAARRSRKEAEPSGRPIVSEALSAEIASAGTGASRRSAKRPPQRSMSAATLTRPSRPSQSARVRNARAEDFDFLGYTFGPRYARDGERYLGARPSMKSLTRIKGKISDLLRPCETGEWPQVRDRLNRLLGGWSTYFGYGTLNAAYRRPLM